MLHDSSGVNVPGRRFSSRSDNCFSSPGVSTPIAEPLPVSSDSSGGALVTVNSTFSKPIQPVPACERKSPANPAKHAGKSIFLFAFLPPYQLPASGFSGSIR